MTSTPSDVERRLTQVSGDVDEIYAMLGGIAQTQSRHTRRLSDLDRKVAGLDTKVTGVDTKVTKLDTKVTELDAKVTKLDTKVTGLGGRLDNVDAALVEVLRRLPD